ncbi:hypothetical protein GGR50DRAFT_470168 [Xylaria sp. CBS 124048]|nr:hypothetical protein GGR50DRAFT_470168 [Xylaria sp. CBS 124048]
MVFIHSVHTHMLVYRCWFNGALYSVRLLLWAVVWGSERTKDPFEVQVWIGRFVASHRRASTRRSTSFGRKRPRGGTPKPWVAVTWHGYGTTTALGISASIAWTAQGNQQRLRTSVCRLLGSYEFGGCWVAPSHICAKTIASHAHANVILSPTDICLLSAGSGHEHLDTYLLWITCRIEMSPEVQAETVTQPRSRPTKMRRNRPRPRTGRYGTTHVGG